MRRGGDGKGPARTPDDMTGASSARGPGPTGPRRTLGEGNLSVRPLTLQREFSCRETPLSIFCRVNFTSRPELEPGMPQRRRIQVVSVRGGEGETGAGG